MTDWVSVLASSSQQFTKLVDPNILPLSHMRTFLKKSFFKINIDLLCKHFPLSPPRPPRLCHTSLRRRRKPLCHNVPASSFQERIDASPVSVTDGLHKQLSAVLRAVWQPGPPVQAEAVLTLMSWGPVREERGRGLALFSYAYTPDVETQRASCYSEECISFWRDVLMILTCNLN